MLEKYQKRYRRHRRVRAKIKGTDRVPRLCVFRSAKHIYGQLIDDRVGKTILSATDVEIKKSEVEKSKIQNPKPKIISKPKIQKEKGEKEEMVRMGKTAIAYEVGRLIAQKALEKKIKKVVFDRDGYKYHGRVKAVAEGARDAGLEF